MFDKGENLRASKAAFTGLRNNAFQYTTSLCPAKGISEIEWRLVMTKLPSWTLVVASYYGLLLAMQSAF